MRRRWRALRLAGWAAAAYLAVSAVLVAAAAWVWFGPAAALLAVIASRVARRRSR